ncbi:hypothetical protein AB0J43_05415 [Nonomuraea fuscirosea]
MSSVLALCYCGKLYAQHTPQDMDDCVANDPSIKAAHLLEIGDVIEHPMFGDGDEWVIVVADLATDDDGRMTITPHKGRPFTYAADLGVQLWNEREAQIYGALDQLLEEERDRIRARREAGDG